MISILPYLLTLALVTLQAKATPLHNVRARSEGIAWGSCEPELEEGADLPISCGNLSVPLDYTATDFNATHTIELVKVAAVHGPSKGTIIFNFGGPGAEGRKNMASTGALYQNITGGQHDLIGLNPRGTSQHFLRFSCYNSEEERLLATKPNPQWMSTEASDTARGKLWADAKVLADSCAERMKDIGEYVGTAFTARDIMRVVDEIGEDPLLNFYGMSYGTALGATIASMFPDRIGSMVLDGVLNPHEYWNAYSDVEMFTDADAAFSGFVSECAAAGQSRCALARNNATAQELEGKIYALFETVKYHPIPLPPSLTRYDTMVGGGSVVDYNVLRLLVFNTLYHPTYFHHMASALDGIFTGNLTAFAAWRDMYEMVASTTAQAEAVQGIRCGDKWRRTSELDDVRPALADAIALSRVAGDGMPHGMYTLPCARWSMDAKERYAGDFRVRTRNPVLLVGNTYDPVTPLASAYNVSAGLEGSVVLHRKGYGHCVNTQESACAYKAIAAYYSEGTLPGPGTECEPDRPLF